MNELLVIMIFNMNELHIEIEDDERNLIFRQTMIQCLLDHEFFTH